MLRTAQPSHSERVSMKGTFRGKRLRREEHPTSFGQRARRSALLLVACGMPGLVRVVTVYALEDCKRIGAQVFLVDDPVVADYERLHARDFVLGWSGRKSKSSDHYAFYHEVHLTQRGGGT